MNAVFLLLNRSALPQIIHAVSWLLLKSRCASIHLLKAVAVTGTWQKPRVARSQLSDAVLATNRKWVKLKWQFLPAQQLSKQSFQH